VPGTIYFAIFGVNVVRYNYPIIGNIKEGDMVLKKVLYVVFGFVFGFAIANIVSVPELMAQYGFSKSSGGFEESVMEPSVPASYGKLVAISGIDMYFQGTDGNVYIVKPRTGQTLDTHVTVVKRGE